MYRVDGATELMRLVAVHNWPQRYAPFLRQMRVRVGSGPSGEAASERRAIEVPDVFADPTLERLAARSRWSSGFAPSSRFRCRPREPVLGTVTFYFASPRRSTAETRELLRIVADQMAATAEKARLIDDLRPTNAALVEANAELERQYVAVRRSAPREGRIPREHLVTNCARRSRP